MSSHAWQIVGYFGMVGYGAAIVLVFVGRHLLSSKNEKHVKLGVFLLAALRGPNSERAARVEPDRRHSQCESAMLIYCGCSLRIAEGVQNSGRGGPYIDGQ